MAEEDLSWSHPETRFDVVALAASLGGIGALSEVLGELPADFPAAVLVAQHRAATHSDLLVELLGQRTCLRVKQAEEREALRPGTVFLAPPGRHLIVEPDGTLSVSRSERVRFVCPSADLLFESVGGCFQGHAIAVVLTGSGDDGAEGAKAVRRRGGYVIAQDSATSKAFGMPAAAIETRHVDLVLPLHHIAFALRTLTGDCN